MDKKALDNKELPMELNNIQDLQDFLEVEDIDVSSDDEQPMHIEVDECKECGDTDGDGHDEYVFKLSLVPGADDEEVEEIPEEPVEMDEKTNTPLDSWDWEGHGGPGKFLNWLQGMFQSIPKHSGQDTTGVERALAYFQRLDTEISRAMKKDYKREIDAAGAEKARSEIETGMERLMERLEKLRAKKFKRYQKSKKASDAFGLVKEAETSTTGKIIISVPYLISNIARTCIESTVQGGRDMEEAFTKLAEDYKLDKREKFQVAQLIKDMGYPILLDRLNFGDEKLTPSAPGIKEHMQQYYA
jgi:hypothetical protein